jgi:tight adherence protein B
MSGLSLGTPAIVTALAVFVALLLLLEGLYLLWRSAFGAEARRLSQRLKALSQERERARASASRAGAGSGPLGAWLQQLTARSDLDRLLLQSDLRGQAGQWLALSVLAAMVTALSLKLFGSAWALALAAGVAVGLLPWAHVLLRRQRRLRLLQAQLPDALDMLTRALRAGHALSSALQMAGQEMSEPVASELRMVHEEVNFGLTLQQAMTHLTERVPLTDLRYFAVAVQIQRESGGNLAEVLGKLAQLIRARLRLLARVRVLSSEGRLSAWILVLLPFVLGGLLAVFNPRFMQPLWTDPIGITLLKWMAGLMLLGVILIARIVRIRV